MRSNPTFTYISSSSDLHAHLVMAAHALLQSSEGNPPPRPDPGLIAGAFLDELEAECQLEHALKAQSTGQPDSTSCMG